MELSIDKNEMKNKSVRNPGWIARIREQGPWDEVNEPLPTTGIPVIPMPVEISDLKTLLPFFS